MDREAERDFRLREDAFRSLTVRSSDADARNWREDHWLGGLKDVAESREPELAPPMLAQALLLPPAPLRLTHVQD